MTPEVTATTATTTAAPSTRDVSTSVREHVTNVVYEYLLEAVEELERNEIDESLSMKDLGANSLDIVEVVSLSMRELRVKIPRSSLAELTNLGQLIDLLAETSAATSDAGR